MAPPSAASSVAGCGAATGGAGAVAATGNGSFVVVWEGYGAGDDAGVFFQRYEPLAAPLTGEGGATEPTIDAAFASLDLLSALEELEDDWLLACQG
jgi:hypothetical protein